jgi:WD40 repeat protein
VREVTISDDARRIAVVLDDDQVQVWDVPASTIVRTWRAASHVSIARLSPDGCYLASGDQCGGLTVDEVRTGRAVVDERPEGNALDPIVAMDFSPDRRLLACGRDRGRVQLWNMATGTAAGELTGHRGPVNAVCFPESGAKLFSTGCDATLRVWDPSARRELQQIGLRKLLPTRVGR